MWVRDGKTAITTKTLLEEKSFCKQSSLLYMYHQLIKAEKASPEYHYLNKVSQECVKI